MEKDFLNNELIDNKADIPGTEDNKDVSWEQVHQEMEDNFGNEDTIMHIKVKGQTAEQDALMEVLESELKQYDDVNSDIDRDDVLEALREVLFNDAAFVVPVELSADDFVDENVQAGDVFKLDEDLKYSLRTLTYKDGSFRMGVFTSLEEAQKGFSTNTITMESCRILEKVLFEDNVESLVINPFSHSFEVSKVDIVDLFDDMADGDTLAKVCFYEKKLHEAEEADAAFEPINGNYEIAAKVVVGVDNPIYSARRGDYKRLYECYWDIFNQALENGYGEIVVPNMGIVGGYPEDKARGIAIKALCEWCDVHPFSALRVMLLCDTKKRSKEYNNSYDRFDKKGRKQIESSVDEDKLYEGLRYAMELYSDMVQTPEHPYMVSALAQMNDARFMGFGTDMLLAALLHDALEEGLTDVDTLVEKFGIGMARVANSQPRYYGLPWLSRKLKQVHNMSLITDDRIKLLAMIKALDELRCLYDNLKRDHDWWNKVYVPKQYQVIYYKLLLEEMKDFEFHRDTERLYQEYAELMKKLFFV